MNRSRLWVQLFSRYSIKFLLPFSLGLLFSGFIAMYGISSSAGASSVFDNTFQTTDNLNFTSGANPQDWSQAFDDIFDDTSGTASNGEEYLWIDGALTNYENLKYSWEAKEHWGVTKSNNGDQGYRIWWTDDDTATASFDGPYGDYTSFDLNVASTSRISFVSAIVNTGYDSKLTINNGTLDYNAEGWPFVLTNHTSSGVSAYHYFANVSIVVYPSGYEGDEVPGSPPSPGVDFIPDFNIVTATGYQLVLQDKNFNTFDGVPFTCESETTPILFYELWQGDDPDTDVLLDSGQFSPTVAYNYTLPTGANTYTVVGWYSCGDDDLVFTDSAFITFELNEYGGLVIGCDDETFAGFICQLGGSINIGIFSTTFNGIIGIVSSFQRVDPSYCNINWIDDVNFQDDYIGVQNMPQEVCDNVEVIYLAPSAPFHTVAVWLNIALSGTAVLLLVFGLLALFGFRVRLPSPIGEEEGTVRPDIATHSSVSRHRASYVKSPGNGRSKGGL